MIVYANQKRAFLDDAQRSDIADAVRQRYLERTGRRVSPSEANAWQASLSAFAIALNDDRIPDDAGVAIEYGIHGTSKRIDMMVSGLDAAGGKNVVIVELKQWQSVEKTEKDGVVRTRMGGGNIETPHPSYQAWSYAELLRNFNEAVSADGVRLLPCAYLHNYPPGGAVEDAVYKVHVIRAPLFLKGEAEREKLRSFISRYVKTGDKLGAIYEMDGARLRPSKGLIDAIAGMMAGRQEFALIDEQKLVFEAALKMARGIEKGGKQVLIVEGGPGTGKSVLAINLLASILKMERVAMYVTKNAAPRAVMESSLLGSMKRSAISNLFVGSGKFTEANENEFDALIIDEAHRLNEKSGLYGNLGENQIKELIHAAKLAIFFIDENQTVTFKDVGSKAEICGWAKSAGAKVTNMELASQFRCNGSDGYVAWLDEVLAVRETANPTLDVAEFDFRVVDSPNQLRDIVRLKNRERNRARMVAGYCWDWKSKKSPSAFDVELPEFDFKMRWNLASDKSLWIIAPNSVEEIGCVHTCQGLELDYVGVVVGPDFVVRDGVVKTQPEMRSKHDRSIKGYKKLKKSNPAEAERRTSEIIKNTYRTLMTRGMKGCYVYFVDNESAAHFKARLVGTRKPEPEPKQSFAEVVSPSRLLPFKPVPRDKVEPFKNAVPLVDLKMAAGAFSEGQYFDEDSVKWVELSGPYKPTEGYFVAQVVGESMNRTIENGAWCLFRMNPAGTRQGKVVVAQIRDHTDPDFGGRYTVKRYTSVKQPTSSDPVGHVSVTLSPDSDDPKYAPLIFDGKSASDMQILAEFVALLDADN
ncbi:MAG: DUF2075 domain-containing protein [Aeromicrobium sp.]|nr:DUF2075 domain-containing protein [Burkholderiales bacterium]